MDGAVGASRALLIEEQHAAVGTEAGTGKLGWPRFAGLHGCTRDVEQLAGGKQAAYVLITARVLTDDETTAWAARIVCPSKKRAKPRGVPNGRER